MKINDIAFQRYFDETLFTKGVSVPVRERLMALEQDFIRVLANLKQNKSDYESYRYLYSVNGKQLISRIGFCIKNIDDEVCVDEMKLLLSSYTRLREALKSLDRNLYEKELRSSIQRGKKQRRSVKKSKPSIICEKPTVFDKPQLEVATIPTSTVISGTQGLADTLGCSKTMAFSIIKEGKLLLEGIQYKVGNCWKFNREKLEKFIEENPTVFSKSRSNT